MVGKLELVTAPVDEPVSLAEARLHLRVDGTAEDTHISDCIAAARRWCESQCRRAFVTQTWRYWLDGFPNGAACTTAFIDPTRAYAYDDPRAILLPINPVASITNVKYVDTAGVLQTLVADTDYEADLVDDPARVLPAYGKDWPAARTKVNAVQVQFVAGVAAASVDPRAKQGVLFLVGHFFENREAVLTGTISKEVELATKALLAQLWNGRIG